MSDFKNQSNQEAESPTPLDVPQPPQPQPGPPSYLQEISGYGPATVTQTQPPEVPQYAPQYGPMPPIQPTPPAQGGNFPKKRVGCIVFGLVVLAIGACAGLVVVVPGAMAGMVGELAKEQAALAQRLDRFMRAGAKNDPVAGYALFTHNGDEGAALSEASVADLYSKHREMFDGYQSVQITNFRVNTVAGGGTTASVAGTATYTGPKSVGFEARLVQEGGVWNLSYFNLMQGVGN
jgi:hypothetical protein